MPTTFLPALAALSLLAADPPGVQPAEAAGALVPIDLPEAVPVPSASAAGSLTPPEPLLGDPSPVADAGDDEEIEEEIEAQSAEMEAMRQAEEKATLLQPMRPEEEVARSAAHLGLESPIRQRLLDALSRDTAAGPEEDPGRIALLPQIGHDLRRLQAEYDIPLEVNEAVLAYIRFFQTEPARGHFVRWLGRSHRYMDRYRQIMRENGLPEDTVFLAMIESGFANLAYSRARASGPWQFISGTGKRMGLKQDFWVDERRDPEKSARAAARYLKELYDQTGDWRLAWAGYNAGVGKVLRAQRKGESDFWAMTRGRVLKKETKGYVPKLMAAAIVTKHPEAFGFQPEEIQPEQWRDYDEVTIPAAADLSSLAQAAEVAERDLLELNPELRRSCTPPRPYALKVPKGSGEAFERNWPSAETSARLSFANHRVERGDSLGAIAAAYGVSASTITRMNGLRPGRRIRPGTELVVPLSTTAKRNGRAPSSEAMARARIQEFQEKNPSSVEKDPPPKPVAARVEQVDGREKATVLVQAGDSLWAIAQKFGVGVDELCRWNGIRNPRRTKLQIGTEIVVYPRAAPSAAPQASAPKPG